MGEAGHAGTVPMMMRRDALAGAAEIFSRRSAWRATLSGEVVATVGVVTISAPATNVIPGHVVLIVDIRSAPTGAASILSNGSNRKSARWPTADISACRSRRPRNVGTTPCDPAFQDGIAAAIGRRRRTAAAGVRCRP